MRGNGLSRFRLKTACPGRTAGFPLAVTKGLATEDSR